MPRKPKLSASLEDYLEAIFHTVAEKQAARAKDIAQRLNVHSSSVTQALRSLAEKKLVNYAPYDLITLTPEGRRAAQDVVRRHETLRDFFTKVLSIDEEIADKGACAMEHALSGPILNRLIQYLQFVESCSIGGIQWTHEAGFHCGQADRQAGREGSEEQES